MNHVDLMGRLARDPQAFPMKGKDGSSSVRAIFTLAVDRRGRDKGADFPSCTAFGKTADVLMKHAKKGTQIAVSGRLSTSEYEKNGKKIYTTGVIVESFDFCGRKADNPANAEVAPAMEEAPIMLDENGEEVPF